MAQLLLGKKKRTPLFKDTHSIDKLVDALRVEVELAEQELPPDQVPYIGLYSVLKEDIMPYLAIHNKVL
jgi:hypothetical protein